MKREVTKHTAINPLPDSELLKNVEYWVKSGLPILPYNAPVRDDCLTILAGGDSFHLYKGDGKGAMACGSTLKLCKDFDPEWFLNLDPMAEMLAFMRPIHNTKAIVSATTTPNIRYFLNNDKTQVFFPACFSYMPELKKTVNTTTVGVTAIIIGLQMGFRQFECYGLDSCYLNSNFNGGQYEPKVDEVVLDVECNGKKFKCSQSNLMQAIDFKNVCRIWGNKFIIKIHGEGLLAQMLKGDTAA